MEIPFSPQVEDAMDKVDDMLDNLSDIIELVAIAAYQEGFEAGKESAGGLKGSDEEDAEVDPRPLIGFTYHGVRRVVRVNEVDHDSGLIHGTELRRGDVETDWPRSYSISKLFAETPESQAAKVAYALLGFTESDRREV